MGWRQASGLIRRAGTALAADTWRDLHACDVLLVCSDNNRSYTYRGQRYAQLVDSLGDALNLNGLRTRSIAYRFCRLTGSRAYGEPVSMNRVLLRIVIASRLISLIKGRPAGSAWQVAHESKLWKTILRNCRPKAVIAIQPDEALCRAGHELGVHVFDLQHGLISNTDDNPYYAWNKLRSKDPEEMPHGFLTWDVASAEVLTPIATAKGALVRVVGNPWFGRFAVRDTRDALVQEAMSSRIKLKRDLPAILVTLQCDLSKFAGDYVTNGVMADCLAQTIRETSHSYCWYLRLHPSQVHGAESVDVQNYLSKQFSDLPNVDWALCRDAALPVMLASVDLHITHYSAVTLEAAWMGIPTGLLDPHISPTGKHAAFFQHERALGIAEPLPLETTAIKRFIEATLANGKQAPSQQLSQKLQGFLHDLRTGPHPSLADEARHTV